MCVWREREREKERERERGWGEVDLRLIYYMERTYVIIKSDKSQDLLSVSWRSKRSGV